MNNTANQPNHALSLHDWITPLLYHIETALDSYLPKTQGMADSHFHEAMHYALLNGGKRLRALLVFATGDMFQADYQELMRAACAVEMIHAYSLVHDDMPAMDNDLLRRGKPTVHVQFGEATALLTGDALQTQAFYILAQGNLPPAQQLEMIRILAHAAGPLGMCGGQALDLANTGSTLSYPALEHMHQLKTGALIEAAVLLGAMCAPHDTYFDSASRLDKRIQDALHMYAKAVGLAFQVVDDILDATSTTATLGKTAGKDAKQHKPTYVSILGLHASHTLLTQLIDEARQALATLNQLHPTLSIDRLAQLSDLIVNRQA